MNWRRLIVRNLKTGRNTPTGGNKFVRREFPFGGGQSSRSRRFRGCVRFLLSLVVAWTSVSGFAFLAPNRPELPNFDRRTETAVRAAAPSQATAAGFPKNFPPVRVGLDPLLHTPKFIHRTDGLLTGPNGAQPGSSAASAPAPGADPARITKMFLQTHTNLFGHGAEVLAAARVQRDFVTPHSGLHTVAWQQELDGILVFEGMLISHVTRRGELVSIGSQFVPAPASAADVGTPNRARLQNAPVIPAKQAVALAAQNVGETLVENEITSLDAPSSGAEKRQQFRAKPLRGTSDAKLTWLPLNRSNLRLCWDVLLTSRTQDAMFRLLVDAMTGQVWIRQCLTEHISSATYNVFTSDSPSPFSPGLAAPDTYQPPLVSRTLVTLSALDTNASPNGWIDDGGNETVGNNVDAYTDHTGTDTPDLPRPQGSPFRVFDFPLDLTQDPATYTNAAIVQLFYWNNWMHDKLYELGFTEAAGNFQSNNFGRGGWGNDAVQAEAQDGYGLNNANFSTPPDGSPPRMEMFLFTGPTPYRDGALDAETVLHEYTHGLSNRRVGGGVGISALQSRGLGEGWSDFYALSLLSEPGDDVNGDYAQAAYVSYEFAGLEENYYYGIRRYPYTTDMLKNPLTLKDIDPAQADPHLSVPINPAINNPADEPHNMGEVWCVALWEARAALINKYGWAAGNPLILRLVTDGMNLSPANPDFLQARDAILLADVVDENGADTQELWTAFAKRGLGFSATSPDSSTTVGIQEAFDLPTDSLWIRPATSLSATGQAGGPFFPASGSYTLVNTSTNPLNWTGSATASWLTTCPANGSIPAGSSVTVTSLVNSVADNLTNGEYSSLIWFTNTGTGAGFSREFWLSVMPAPPVVAWGSNDNAQATPPPGLSNVLAIAAGRYHSLALEANGTVVGWGSDLYGQIDVPGYLTNVIGIAAANWSSVGLLADNTLVAWGSGPSIPPDLTNVVAVAPGWYHCLALTADRMITAWGNNNLGQSDVPADLTNTVAVAAGRYHSLALEANGTLRAWGDNSLGQTNIPPGLTNAVAIAAGCDHNLALRADGTVIAWGDNTFGQTNVPAGLTQAVAIAAGAVQSMALQANGSVVMWGAPDQTNVPPNLTNAIAITCGAYHNLALRGPGPPVLRASFFHPRWSSNGFRVDLPTRSGHVYSLEYKSSLSDTEWTPLPLASGNGGMLTLTDSTTSLGQRFYRVREW